MKKMTLSVFVSCMLLNISFAGNTNIHQDANANQMNKKFKQQREHGKKMAGFIKDSLGLTNEQKQKLESYGERSKTELVEQKIAAWKNKLNLSDAQVDQARSAFATHTSEVKAIKKDNSTSEAIKATLLEQAKEKLHSTVMGYLTDAQKEKFASIMEKAKMAKSLIGGGSDNAINAETKMPTKEQASDAAKKSIDAPANKATDEINKQADKIKSLF